MSNLAWVLIRGSSIPYLYVPRQRLFLLRANIRKYVECEKLPSSSCFIYLEIVESEAPRDILREGK